jgi:hypothetical protein
LEHVIPTHALVHLSGSSSSVPCAWGGCSRWTDRSVNFFSVDAGGHNINEQTSINWFVLQTLFTR